MSPHDAAYEHILEAASGLPHVTTKRMFGHDAFFAAGSIFAIAYDGAPTLKLPDPRDHERAMATPGAAAFDPMGAGKGMAHWVVLPADLLDEPAALREWVRRAHALALAAPPPRRKGGRGPGARG